MTTIENLLNLMVEQNASDLHLKARRPPLLRLGRDLVPHGETPLDPDIIKNMVFSMLNDRQKNRLEESLWLDMAYSVPGLSRFRVSITHQRSSLGAVFRRIPFKFPTLEEWNLPDVLQSFASLESGLVLVTGPTGSGKSSTLAALLRLVCDTRPVHVVTIEDPIEFLIHDSVGAISQREIGTDTLSFGDALRNALRQDPDVIAVGEMRDLETIATTITAGETGHLVFSTLHTNSAPQTIDRIIDAFPAKQQAQIRTQLAQVLRGIISLKLVPEKSGTGLTAAVELLRNTPRIARLIEEGRIQDIRTEMEKSVSFFKMQTMNQSLIALVLNNAITVEAAQSASTNPEDFEREMRKFLHYQEGSPSEEGSEMGHSRADFSKIVELQEVKRLYDECQERHQAEIAGREHTIQELRQALSAQVEQAREMSQSASESRSKVEKIRQQAAFLKRDLEAKVAKLQARVKELSAAQAQDPGTSSSRRSFFSR
ncbi:MAG: PilT/PilU family type 4a pilus ATPase [Acidobacteriota bacterium]